MDLDGIIVRLYSEFSPPIVELALDAGEKSVGKTLRLYAEKGLSGRQNDSISTGSRLAGTPERVHHDAFGFHFQDKGATGVIEPTIDSRLTFSRSHDISKKINVIPRIRIPEHEAWGKNLIHKIVMMRADLAFTKF